MKSIDPALTLLAVLALGAGPALAQQSNANKPAAPAPSKAGSLDTGGKPQTEKAPDGAGGGAMMKKNAGGSMKSGGMKKTKKHR